MTTVFDGMRAIREEIEGLNGVRTTLIAQERRAESALGEAEAQLNALRKLRAFADAEIARKRTVLAELSK